MTKENKNKELFNKWLKDQDISIDLNKAEKSFKQAASAVGINVTSIFNENDPIKIQLLTSEIIISRNKLGSLSTKEFNETINTLVCYSDYLNNKPSNSDNKHSNKKGRKLDSESLIRQKDYYTVAYYLSKYNMKAVNSLGYDKFSDAFKGLGNILDQKPATIKNMRDSYDPYFDNGRVGWYQRELTGTAKEIYDKYYDVEESKLLKEVKLILDKYKNRYIDNNKKHITLKISDNSEKNMREYYTKKRKH